MTDEEREEIVKTINDLTDAIGEIIDGHETSAIVPAIVKTLCYVASDCGVSKRIVLAYVADCLDQQELIDKGEV